MTLKLMLDVMSQPSRAVLLFCRATNIQHEFKPIMIKNMDHKTPEFTKLNPFQTSPLVVDGDVPIRDSNAILRYLSVTRDVPDHWYPKEPLAQARVDEYLHWQHFNTRAACAMYFQYRWLQPTLTQTAPDEKKVSKQKHLMEKALDSIEQHWLDQGKKKYICGDQISVADIQACCELEQPKCAGYDVRAHRPILKTYMDRVRADLNPHYDDVHKAIDKMTQKFGGRVPGVDFDPDQKAKL